MNLLWTAAALMAFVTFAVHTFVGTSFSQVPLVVAPGTGFLSADNTAYSGRR